jgi:hypothetical protein
VSRRSCAYPVALLLAACATSGQVRSPAAPPPEPIDYDRQVGLVLVKGDGQAVLYHLGEQPRPDTAVQVVLPRERQVLAARVIATPPPVEEYVQKPFDPDAQAGRVALALQGARDQMPAVGIGIIGRQVAFDVGDVVQAELDGEEPPETFRVCASSEGAHLTIWSGAPLVGQRRWHAYYYAGYDTEADCTPGDFRVTPPIPAL